MERIKFEILVDIESGEMDSQEFLGEVQQQVFDAAYLAHPKIGAVAKAHSIKLGKVEEEERKQPLSMTQSAGFSSRNK